MIINSAQLPNGNAVGYPSIQCLRAAELFLLERALKGMKTSRTKSLNVDTVTEEDVIGVKRKLIVIGTRGRNRLQGVYGQTDLPVLAKDHKLSELYVQAAHDMGHKGGDHHIAQIKKESVDHQRTSASRFDKGPVHRMPTERKKMHGAEDGPPTGPQSSNRSNVSVSSHRSVWPNRVPATCEEEASRQRLRGGVRVHHDVCAAC